jgi:hypothetical protein
VPLHKVFEQVERVAADGRLPVVVFDLDSTLFDTAARNLRIVQEFSELRGEASLASIVGALTLADFGWSALDPLRARGVVDPGLLADLDAFWADRFFTDAYVLEDHAAPGAPAFVRGCYDRGALCYYLTGRHQGGMEAGTLQALIARGFPVLRGRTVLHLKPSFHLEDRAFKETAVREIRSLRGEVVATFENEPGNANLFRSAFPGALHFLVGGVRSPGGEAAHGELIAIQDFHPR